MKPSRKNYGMSLKKFEILHRYQVPIGLMHSLAPEALNRMYVSR
jgi:hypothetical protein